MIDLLDVTDDGHEISNAPSGITRVSEPQSDVYETETVRTRTGGWSADVEWNVKQIYTRITTVLAATTALVACQLTVLADDEAFGIAGPPATAFQAPITPLSKAHGAMLPVKYVPYTLDKLDNARLAQIADAQPREGKPYPIGIARPVFVNEAMGQWVNTIEGGRVWSMEIESPDAVGLRVHFTEMNLPEGAEIVVYAPADLSQIGGPYSKSGDFDTGDQYSPIIFADRVRIEYHTPKNVPEAIMLPFEIDLVQHIYRDPIKDGIGGVTPAEGTCHNDVTCQTAWANVAKAVGRYTFSDNLGSYLCTGQLIATQNNDLTPYFLTARHCVSTQSVANTVQVFWLYQTATCNSGSPPALGSLNTTSGSTLIATRTNSDGTLLRLTGALPGGLYWVGWTATPVTTGSNIACIHHPDGAYKRISFGTATDQAGCSISGVVAENVRANWTSGVTEGGSSGGGLYKNDANQQLIGTLSCGPSACGASSGNLNDGFGRFASFYPDIASFLVGGTDDSLEENDSCVTARAIATTVGTPVTNSGLTVKLTDEDWYSFSVPATDTISVSLAFTNANGNIDAQLFTTCGGSVISSSTSTTNAESVTYTNNGGTTQTVYVRVFLNAPTTSNTYSMTASVTAPPPPSNNVCASAFPVASGGTYNGTTVGMTIDGSTNCITTQRADVWYSFTAVGNVRLMVDTCSSTTDTVVSLHSACPGTSSNQLSCSDDAAAGVGPCGSASNRTSYVTRDMTNGQTVLIRVAMYGATAGAFVMHVNTTALGVSNDVCDDAISIGVGATAFNNTNANSEGPDETACNYFSFSGVARDMWYQFDTPSYGDTVIDTCGSSYDTKLAVYTNCPSATDHPIACDDDAVPACPGSTLTSRVTLTGLEGGTSLYIRVGGYRSAAGVDTFGAGTLNVTFTPTTPPCPPDVGMQGGTPGPDGFLDNNDFVAFIDLFFANDPAADLGVQGGTLGSDGLWDNNDFVAFIDAFFNGCGS